MEKKLEVNVIPKDGKLIFGKNVIELQDKTCAKFETDNLSDFKRKILSAKPLVFVDGLRLLAYEIKTINNPTYTSEPIAICILQQSSIIKNLLGLSGKELNLQMFSEFIRSMKSFLKVETLLLHDNLNDLKIKKIVDIEHQSDRRGNFCFTVKAEKGKSDYEFPQTIGFNVPLFEYDFEKRISLDFDLLFTWAMSGTEVILSFKIISYVAQMMINEENKKIITQEFLDSGIEIFQGKIDLHRKTDEYRYKESTIAL